MAYTTINDPSLYFRAKSYTGNGANNRAVVWDETHANMQADWLWFKSTAGNQSHALFDSVRGAVKRLISNSSGGQGDEATNLDSFDTNGFTVDAEAIVNGSSRNYVTWGWKAGTSFTNDASGTGIGTIDSAGSVNTDAGFSIISYTGNGNDDDTAKIAHGLGVALNMIIVKCRNATGGWQTSSTSLGFNNVLQLNETNAQASGTYAFGRTGVAPTSTVFTVSATSGGNHTNTNNNTYIAYCFAEKKGYSKFGSYTGNGSTDGPFPFCSFRPAFVMIKQATDASTPWFIFDTKRNPGNKADLKINPNSSNAESAANEIDILSNGFKLRTSGSYNNGSGKTMIFMAFAENPFVTSTGVPATAR